jgi:hypothetical protein
MGEAPWRFSLRPFTSEETPEVAGETTAEDVEAEADRENLRV